MNFTDCVQEKFQFHKNLKRRRYRPRRGRRWFIVGQSVWIKWWKRMVRKWRPDVGKWRTKKSNKKFEKKRKKKGKRCIHSFYLLLLKFRSSRVEFCWFFSPISVQIGVNCSDIDHSQMNHFGWWWMGENGGRFTWKVSSGVQVKLVGKVGFPWCRPSDEAKHR